MHAVPPPKLAREKRRPPADFVPTCQPILAKHAPTGDGWLFEVKHDGWRIVSRHGDRPRVWSRHMLDHTDHFQRIRDALAALPVPCVLDGEAIVFHPDGHSRFEALASKRDAAYAAMIVFDVTEIDGQDVRRKPIEQRRAYLEELLAPTPDGLQLSKAMTGNGPVIYQHACAMGWRALSPRSPVAPTGRDVAQPGSRSRTHASNGVRTVPSAERFAGMNEYVLTFSGGAEPYVEEVYADLDPDAIELAEASAAALCEGDWTEAVLLDNEGAEIWTKRREPCR